ncbi:MAG TPA: fasciclin domain-containing protein [Puia sp.]|jgi:uncharacterized surface protein with fasciclin (FAS1) repeats
MRNTFHTLTVIGAALVLLAYGSSCRKIQIVTSTTTDVNIYSYLQQHADSFSQVTALIDKAGYGAFLNAYGTYTFFAPGNSAVKSYLASINKTIDQLQAADAQAILKLHLIQDTLNTNTFTDGKLPIPTMYGQYLITGVGNAHGTSLYTVNRQADITQPNIFCANGIIHVLDAVLKPATLSIAQFIAADPKYTIFTQALKETGFYDSLNIVNNPDTNRTYLTLLAQPDQTFIDSGYANYAALKARLSTTGNPRNPLDSLWLFVAYHILPKAQYLADIISAQSHTTLAPLEVVTSSYVPATQTALINDDIFNGVHEQGVVLDRNSSDNTATNGVVHNAQALITMRVRVPTPVYWDVADFPEIRKLPLYFRRQNYSFAADPTHTNIKTISWDATSNGAVVYTYTSSPSQNYYWGDYLVIGMSSTGNRPAWLQLTTPLIVKGKYNVWICYRTQKQSSSSNIQLQATFDGQSLTRTFSFTTGMPSGLSEGDAEALGWKAYTVPQSTNWCARLLGSVDVATTDVHTLYIQVLSGSNSTNNLDMIHFIPVNMNQVHPRFKNDGTLDYIN